MLRFLRKIKFSNLPLEFCKFMQRFWSTSKKPSSPSFQLTSCLDNCRLFILNRVLQRWRLKTTGQVSPVQFSCTKKLWDEAGGQPVLPCLSRRLYLISKSISCRIDLRIKQIRKQSIYHERYGISSVCF